jgi:hypothetical protein
MAIAGTLASLDRITRIMPKLSLDHDQRHAFVRHLNCVRMSKLVRREASSDGCGGGRVM